MLTHPSQPVLFSLSAFKLSAELYLNVAAKEEGELQL